MSEFEKCLAFTLTWEGGFNDDVRDHGGATNYGVSLRFLEGLPLSETDFDGDGTLTWRDVKAMDMAAAASIYRRHFWDPLRCGEMPGALALPVFDGAVNMGTGRSVRFLQKAVNSMWKAGALKEDGVLGPATWRAVEFVLRKAPTGDNLAFACIARRVKHYKKLGASAEFAWAYKGWMHRTRDLWDAAMGRPWPKAWN